MHLMDVVKNIKQFKQKKYSHAKRAHNSWQISKTQKVSNNHELTKIKVNFG